VSARLTAARVGIVAAGVVWGSFTAVWTWGLSAAWLWTTDAAVVVAFAVAAAVALPRAQSASMLAVLVAMTWSVVAFTPAVYYWHRAAIILLVLAAPRLWPRETLSRVVVVIVAAVSATPYLWSIDEVAIALAAGLGVCLALLRRTMATSLLAAAWTATALFAVAGLWRRVVPDPAMLEIRAILYSLGLVAIAWMVTVSVAQRPAVILADDVIRIAPAPRGLRDRMAAAVGDPHLQLAWWDPQRLAFVDDAGSEVPVGSAGAGTAIRVVLGTDDEALITCSPTVASDPQTREALIRATVLATEAERLDRELARRAEEVARSNERLLVAGDAERSEARRLLDAHVGEPLQALAGRLATVGRANPAAAGPSSRAAALFERGARQLRDISMGLPPAELEAGLTQALHVLRAAAPLPVAVEIDAAVDDLPISTPLFYICAEGLSNAVKHAAASEVTIAVVLEGDVCHARIADDGRGGAAVGAGGGLAGLRDRVEALGGRLTVRSPASEGTVIEFWMPTGAVGGETPAPVDSAELTAEVVR
jgi:signal transduction histidine kinase